jgi:hypothetical protein
VIFDGGAVGPAMNRLCDEIAGAKAELEEIGPNELWPRMRRYCQAVGASIDL